MDRALILMYHHIGTPPKGVGKRNMYVPPRLFRFHMWYLKVAGFKVVPLRDVFNFVQGEESRGNTLVALTFDDGYQDFYDNAYPVLQSHGFPSTVFVVSDMVGQVNVWDLKQLGDRKRLLDWDVMLKLRDNGVVFGSHTRTHAFLQRVPEEAVEDEIRGSKAVLEDHLQTPVEFFCYPYGEYDQRAVHAVRDAGYLGGVTTQRGYVYKDDDPFTMKRVSIQFKTRPLSFMHKLHFKYRS